MFLDLSQYLLPEVTCPAVRFLNGATPRPGIHQRKRAGIDIGREKSRLVREQGNAEWLKHFRPEMF
jgi:hypothetical protein